MENLHSIIRELRTHLQDAYDYNIKHKNSVPYQKAAFAGERKLKELGLAEHLLYMKSKEFELILERDPELKSQRIK